MTTAVRRRTVLYLSGFDPRGARYYYRLFRSEAAKQSEVSGYPIQVGARTRLDTHVSRWIVRTEQGAAPTETDYLFCEWDDIVREFWVKSPLMLALVTLTASWRALRVGVFAKTLRWSWPAAMTSTMPAVVILTLLLVTAALGALGAYLIGSIGLLAGFAIGLAMLWFAYRLERKFNLTWVGRILSFHEREEQSRTHMLDRRRDLFGDLLKNRLAADDADEVLVVGHSYGAALAIAVVARALPVAAGAKPKLSLLTLGQTTMWLAWLPRAMAMREEIAAVATSPDVDWIDVSAPPDGACFALVDPYTAIGDRDPTRANPKLINAKFHETMSPAAYARRNRDWIQLHFQYLMASVQPADYDYFAITAGPLALADRFAHRRSARDFTRLRRGGMKQIR